MHVRLVKGAYWDYEIKHAQVAGYDGYPVFSKKSITDIAYLACAKEILKNKNIFPKFATHNAHTISAIHHLGKDNNYTKAWELNERHYGSLTGLNKAQTKKKIGEEQFKKYRRSWDIPPPKLDKDSEYNSQKDPLYKGLKNIPSTESL